jgi:hypothetical protein
MAEELTQKHPTLYWEHVLEPVMTIMDHYEASSTFLVPTIYEVPIENGGRTHHLRPVFQELRDCTS